MITRKLSPFLAVEEFVLSECTPASISEEIVSALTVGRNREESLSRWY